MRERIGWGILGPGNIAHKFAVSLKVLPQAHLTAVASRSEHRAQAFAARHGFARAYGSYQELANDPDVDIVYVATPHNLHLEHALMCLDAGKAVLCEKPLAPNAAQAARMIDAARKKRLFLMEAMWTRYMPAMRQAMAWLREGRIGTPHMLSADFGARGEFDAASRLYDPKLAGGMLMDIGVYPLWFASQVFGCAPERYTAYAHMSATGVDAQVSMMLKYGNASALLSSSALCTTSNTARIDGSEGYILLPMFWKAQEAYLHGADGTRIECSMPYAAHGYQFEALEAMECLRRGLIESPLMPLEESRALLEITDGMRGQIGLKYPFETDEGG